ncbi:MAG: response regulator [Nostocales cyanobacterium]|nr:MAG: response regulator [Nostocales cyanobacterium]TAF19175.1 MAG: response regulator [Nostocales cyanobacterium]
MPVVVISVFDDYSKAKSLGADDYLVKPINREQICQTINKLLIKNKVINHKNHHVNHHENQQNNHTSATTPLAIPIPPKKPHLILIAEDNEANIATISSYLGAKGYNLIMAKNGEEAVDLTLQEHPHLILMDIQMPGMDGIEAMGLIRAQPEFKHIPIIALTALAMTGDKEKCIAAGANEYIAKPVKLKSLVEKIQQLLEPNTNET